MQAKSRWNFFWTVLHENIDLIFGPAITIVPQLFSLPQLILSSVIGCDNFGTTTVTYFFIVSFFVSFTPQLISFLLYVKSSSVYYAHFRSTSVGKKVVLSWKCCHQGTRQDYVHSEPFRHVLSYTAKVDNSLITENTHPN
jgi:hypothetical protein